MKPNIFGKTRADYAYIKAMEANAKWERYCADLSDYVQKRGKREIKLGFTVDAIDSVQEPSEALLELGAASYAWASANTSAMTAELDEIMRRMFIMDQFVPINTTVPQFATSYEWRRVERTGRGKRIVDSNTDVPRAGANVTKFTAPIHRGGIAAEWDDRDLEVAMGTGFPLNTESLTAAGEGAMTHLETTLFSGDPDGQNSDSGGLINMSAAASPTADQVKLLTSEAWIDNSGSPASDATLASRASKAVQAAITDIVEETKRVYGTRVRTGMTVALPISKFAVLTNTPFGDNADKAVRQFLLENNVWRAIAGNDVRILVLEELKGAGGTNIDRMITYVNDDSVLEMAIPRYPTTTGTVAELGYVVVGFDYLYSELVVKRPRCINYTNIAADVS